MNGAAVRFRGLLVSLFLSLTSVVRRYDATYSAWSCTRNIMRQIVGIFRSNVARSCAVFACHTWLQLAEGQYELRIQAGDLAQNYTTPGQYVQIRVGDEKPGFYAIASAPGDENNMMEFLIKENDRTKPLCSAEAGSSVQMSRVMGNGFPIKEHFTGYKYDFPIQNVVITATGTGIAPIRAAIDSGILERADGAGASSGPFGRTCKLYWGVRNEDSMPWADKFEEWDERGFEVVPVLSQPSELSNIPCKLLCTKMSRSRSSCTQLCILRSMHGATKRAIRAIPGFQPSKEIRLARSPLILVFSRRPVIILQSSHCRTKRGPWNKFGQLSVQNRS